MNFIRRITVLFFVLILPVLLPGQMPAPFKYTPQDAGALVRMDYGKMVSHPALSEMVQEAQQADPDFLSSAVFSNDPELGFLSKDFPGDPKVEEGSLSFSGNQEPKLIYYTVYGMFQPMQIMEKLQGAGWTDAGKVGELSAMKNASGSKFMTMPNEWTLLFADSMENLSKMMAKGGSEERTPNAAVSNSILYASGNVSPEMQETMQQMVQQQGQMAMAIPGGPQFLKELPNVRSFMYAVGGDNQLMATLSAGFSQEQSAQNLAAAGNMMLPFVFQMLSGQAAQAGDEELVAQLQQLSQSTKFAAQGTQANVVIPIPKAMAEGLFESILASAAMASQQNAMGGAGSVIPAAQRQPFPNINMIDIKEQPVNLANYKDKVVLIDYWASWCGPCRATIPHIKEMQSKYKDQGFEIIGVSLDNNPEQMNQYMNSAGMNWRQVSDFKGWDSRYAAALNVRSIPATFLLDKQGRLMAANLRGAKLEQAVRTGLAE